MKQLTINLSASLCNFPQFSSFKETFSIFQFKIMPRFKCAKIDTNFRILISFLFHAVFNDKLLVRSQIFTHRELFEQTLLKRY